MFSFSKEGSYKRYKLFWFKFFISDIHSLNHNEWNDLPDSRTS